MQARFHSRPRKGTKIVTKVSRDVGIVESGVGSSHISRGSGSTRISKAVDLGVFGKGRAIPAIVLRGTRAAVTVVAGCTSLRVVVYLFVRASGFMG